MAQAKQRPVITSIKGTYKPKWRKRLGILLLVLILAAAGYLVYKHIQKDRAIAKEHEQYIAAEADLNNLADRIIAQFGKPADRQKNSYCDHTSVEFGEGDLYCVETVSVVYGVTDRDAATQLTSTALEVLKQDVGFRFGSSSATLASSTSPPPTQLLSASATNKSGLKCNFDYTYFIGGSQDDTHNPYIKEGQAALELDSSCGSRPAQAAYFQTLE